jgi:hypothetical protein
MGTSGSFLQPWSVTSTLQSLLQLCRRHAGLQQSRPRPMIARSSRRAHVPQSWGPARGQNLHSNCLLLTFTHADRRTVCLQHARVTTHYLVWELLLDPSVRI